MPRADSQDGFSIAEVLVAFGILALGMMAVGSMLLTSMSSGRYSVEQRQSDAPAVMRIEQLKADAADNTTGITSGSDFFPPAPSTLSLPEKAKFEARALYHYRWNVTKDSPASGVDRIDITVGWGGGANCNNATPENCKYRTIITNFAAKKIK
ncbi:MAG: hypothetical protein AB1664_00950 [Thermodesulfobacteriota bacterium]